MSERALPTFDNLPSYKGLPGCAWEVWGVGDTLGTVNLLTDAVVQRAAVEEIQAGQHLSLDLPLQFFASPMQGPAPPVLYVSDKYSGNKDDELDFNTKVSSQWTGLLHTAIEILKDGSDAVLYQGIRKVSIPVSVLSRRVEDVHPNLLQLGIHNWAQHGICGRGVLLDMVRFYQSRDCGTTHPPYVPCKGRTISATDVRACAQAEGVEFRSGDILLIHMGPLTGYRQASMQERELYGPPLDDYIGLESSVDMLRFLWDTHFAAIATDMPSLEQRLPGENDRPLHETLAGLWGMPIGKSLDLGALSKICLQRERWTFFFASWPLNILGGVASPLNAAAIM